jgi:hypothetical protein
MPRQLCERRCQNRASTFINSPLCREESFADQFFVVAVPLKPYYNPANLEKAGACVKQKEFIRRFGGAQAAAHFAD